MRIEDQSRGSSFLVDDKGNVYGSWCAFEYKGDICYLSVSSMRDKLNYPYDDEEEKRKIGLFKPDSNESLSDILEDIPDGTFYWFTTEEFGELYNNGEIIRREDEDPAPEFQKIIEVSYATGSIEKMDFNF